MRIDLKCPVECRGASIKTSTKTNENYAMLKLYNLSERIISEVEFTAKVFDTYGKELGSVPVHLTNLSAEPKDFFAQNKAILLEGFTDAKHITAEFLRITFDDGEEYIPDGSTIDVTMVDPDPEEADRLREVAGQDAVCYAKDPGEYWLCVCGRANENDAEACVRCGRDKKFLLEKFSSRQALNAAYEEKKIADDRAELERFKAIERAKQERKEKLIKNSVKGLIGLLCLAILCVAGYFIYGFTVTQIANSHVKKGNYLKAYNMYSSVNSSSIGKASEHVKGNSPSNLFASGILTEDDKNYYYVNGAVQINIENKETGEVNNTGIRGLSLNAVEGTLYYLNIDDNYKIYKLNAETLETVPVSGLEEVTAYSLAVVGSDIYYVTAEMMGQGEQAQQMPVLYSFREGKKPVKMSDAPIQFFDVYKGKVYFISSDQTQSIYVLDKAGAEPKMILEGPVGQFEIKDDIIYYLDYTTPADSADGMPVFSINTADMNGNFINKLTGDTKAVNFTFGGDKLYFGNFSNAMSLASVSVSGGEIETVLEGSYNIINAAGDIAVVLNENGEMIRVDLKTKETSSIIVAE